MDRRRRAARRRAICALFDREELAAKASPRKPRIECPICGHTGWSFYPYLMTAGVMRFNAACPECQALERHRLIKLVLDELEVESWQGPLLHFAPEPHLGGILKGATGLDYRTADLQAPAVDYQVDIQHLPFEDDCWSYIVCSHVLEHVPNDGQALAELRRVLRPGGLLVLAVPVETEQAATVEFGEPNPLLSGHLRYYGADFANRVAKHFTVEHKGAEQRSIEEVLRFGLTPRDMLLICT